VRALSEKLLEIKDERLSFFTPAGEVKALNGVSFSMEEGEVLGIVGESGSGKSVTAYSIMGLTAYPGKLVGGTVHFNGHEIEKMTEKEFRKIRGNEVSIIFQDPMTSLNPVYTIGNQIVEVILLHTNKTKKEAYERAKELLELVGINEPTKRLKQYPHELSGGMRQRVMIAIALACEPKLLIADEPTTALDVTIQAQILELMQELRKKLGMSIIMITHDLGVVASMCEKIAVMYAGHIVEYGTADEIFYNPSHEYTKGLIKSIPKLNAEKIERLVPIEGQPVDLLNPPAGCPFAPRCSECMKICLNKMPPKTELSDTHYSYCWLLQKEALKGEENCE
jgi:oligopeptide transport system ATP-binding protein